jgi:hypothetical protein
MRQDIIGRGGGGWRGIGGGRRIGRWRIGRIGRRRWRRPTTKSRRGACGRNICWSAS